MLFRSGVAARETLDAEGRVVAPGFVDGHTHMDAQVFWDPIGTSSCFQGVTSVVMGNCGFTLAPCAAQDKHLVVRNLQRAEDIPPAAMEAGIKWNWTTYPEFLDALEALPKGINYASYVGHSAIRTFVMGERAFTEAATEDDLRAMEHQVGDAIRAHPRPAENQNALEVGLIEQQLQEIKLLGGHHRIEGVRNCFRRRTLASNFHLHRIIQRPSRQLFELWR